MTCPNALGDHRQISSFIPQCGTDGENWSDNEAEAAAIRELFARFLAGESLSSLVKWLDESDIRTVTGKTWRSPTVRNILTSPRNAGLSEYRRQVIGQAQWAPIVTPEQHAKALAILNDPKRRTNRSARRYLLTGLLRCGLCGGKLNTMSLQSTGTRRYLCRSGPNFGNGCGRITITAAPVEQLISEAVLMRLDSPELADALAGRMQTDATSARLSEEIAADTARLEELSQMFGEGEITGPEWKVARASIDRRLQANRRRPTAMHGAGAITGHVGNGAALRDQWD